VPTFRLLLRGGKKSLWFFYMEQTILFFKKHPVYFLLKEKG